MFRPDATRVRRVTMAARSSTTSRIRCHQPSNPIANVCASGALEHFPKIRFAAVEFGIGWVPWALNAMGEAYRKHHLWVN
jgi:hypothetical protein